MRCLSCNKNLSDYEATRKSANTGEFIDLCNGCFNSVSEDLQTIERSDLAHEEDYSDENDSYLDFDIDKDY
jgi:hypothetical protein